MFEVECDGEIFFFDNFREIEEFFNEVVFAVGAVDAQLSVKFANPLND
jgi:hypothetical protein